MVVYYKDKTGQIEYINGKYIVRIKATEIMGTAWPYHIIIDYLNKEQEILRFEDEDQRNNMCVTLAEAME